MLQGVMSQRVRDILTIIAIFATLALIGNGIDAMFGNPPDPIFD